MDLKNKRLLKVKSKKIANSFKYAGEGFISSFKTERNMKIHIIIMLLRMDYLYNMLCYCGCG